MVTLHRPYYRTSVWMGLIVVLLLSACGTPPPTPTIPRASSAPVDQPSSQPSPSASPAASPAPSAAPASPTPEQPTAQASPTAQADLTQPDSHPPTVGAFYLWPVVLPDGFEIRRENASVNETSFRLEIGAIGGGHPTASIVGGKGSLAEKPPTSGQQAEIIVRTTKGLAYEYGAGYSIHWEEQGIPYAIIGDLSLDQAITIADSLQSTDLATWQANFAAVK